MVGNYQFTGSIAIVLGNDIIEIDNPKVKYKNFKIEFGFSQSIPMIGIYPRVIQINGNNSDYDLTLNLNVLKNKLFYIVGPTRIVNEQVSKFSGVLTGNNITYTFENIGFSEYTKFRFGDLF